MKICFYLQRRFAFVGHEIAKSLHTKYPFTSFCGYVQIREGFEFLKNQPDIAYTSLLLDEDIFNLHKSEKLDLDFLKKLEAAYGIPYLWPYIEIDRIVRYGQHVREYPHDTSPYSHEDMLKILQVTAKAILKFLDTEKPDAIIFSVVGAMSSLLLYTIAKKQGIPVYIFLTARVGTKHTLTSDYTSLSFVEESYQKIKGGKESFPAQQAEVKKYLQQFRARPEPYTFRESPKIQAINRKRQFYFLLPKNFLRSLQWTATIAYKYLTGKERHDYSTIKPWHYIIDKIKQKTRLLVGYENLYDGICTDEPFVFFPLQLEPEISTMLYAPWHTDQLWVIKQVAKSLPVGYKLYVKEHPTMFGKRPYNFYAELKKIPNLRLIAPTVESFDLTQRARLTATISSTAGWEALLLKKPALTFGNIFYNALPNVRRSTSIEQLPYLIKEILGNNNHDEQALVDYITAIYVESVDIDLVEIWEVEGGGKLKTRGRELESVADLIAKKLNLQT